MSKNSKKISALVHYIVWYFKHHIKGKQLDIIKLNKILWIIDTRSYCLKGCSISGKNFYIKRRFGAVPDFSTRDALKNLQIPELIDEENNAIDLNQRIPRSAESFSLLNETELKEVRKACKEYGKWTAEELSELSHDEIYDLYKMGDEIPLGMYRVASSRKPNKAEVEKMAKWVTEAKQKATKEVQTEAA